jgi:N-acetyl-gamma-glutamyl-phosphate reductase
MRVAVVGASGYTGAEMLRLIQGHPHLECSGVYAGSSAGQPLADHHLHLDRMQQWVLGDVDVEAIAKTSDWVVLGLPHGTSASVAAACLDAGLGVVDLSASFRLPAALYAAHYGDHPCPDRIEEAVYGLPELHREALRGARLIAGPGCFPTGVTLACAPLLRQGLVADRPLIADCKTGVTGAGAKLSAGTHFCRVADTVTPYKVEGHRHRPEIERNLSQINSDSVVVRFTPHLVPIRRGILSTCYLPLKSGVSHRQLESALRGFAADEPFVDVVPAGVQPSLARVAGTNDVELQVVHDETTQMAVVTSAIDNLCKGSSGGALQALNVAMGWDEGAGLSSLTPALP